jgi:hypothetical protein
MDERKLNNRLNRIEHNIEFLMKNYIRHMDVNENSEFIKECKPARDALIPFLHLVGSIHDDINSLCNDNEARPCYMDSLAILRRKNIMANLHELREQLLTDDNPVMDALKYSTTW